MCQTSEVFSLSQRDAFELNIFLNPRYAPGHSQKSYFSMTDFDSLRKLLLHHACTNLDISCNGF